MKVILYIACIYTPIILWLFLKYRAEVKLDKIRDYDRKCQIEVERKARDER